MDRGNIVWTVIRTEAGRVHAAATSRGLCFVGSQDQSFEELSGWAQRRLPGMPLIRDDEAMQPYAAELVQYLQGQRESFTLPLDVRGTAFQEAVWSALRAIPYGETRSYADIAHHIGKPAALRAVGAAIGANPVLVAIPCHRVVGKSGKLTGYRGGLEMKQYLLHLENARENTGRV